MEEVAGDAAWMESRRVGSGPSVGSTVRLNQEENAAISVQPLWWRRLGRSFIRGNGDADALPVVYVVVLSRQMS